MSAPAREGGCVRFFCTAGNGMEPFLLEELRRKLEAEDVTQLSGKVLFSSSVRIHRVVELKAAERLFLLLKHESPLQLSGLSSSAKAAAELKSRLLGDRKQWSSAALTWSRLQGELAQGRATAANTSSTPQGGMSRKEEGRGSEEQMEEKGCCDGKSGKRAREQREEERESRGLRGGEDPEEAPTLEKKRKRDMSRGSCGVEEQMLEKRITRKNHEEEASEKERQDEDEEEERRMISSRGSVQSGSRKENDRAEDLSVENMEHGEEDEKPAELSRIRPEITSSVPLSFRISCKCTGSVSRLFSSQEVSRVMGVGLSRMMNWKVDLKNPQLEVNVYLSDDLCLLGIPLSRLPLAHRSYMKTTGLRSTVAWAMTSLAQIQPGSCVVDPMCGVGTILIEAAQEHQAACFLGVDIDDRQLQRANENVEFAELRTRIQLLKASSMALPLPSGSVDALICDLPFGRKFGTKSNMAASLPVMVAEMERVLRVGGALVLLLTPQLSFLLKKLLTPPPGSEVCPCPPLSSTEQRTVPPEPGVRPSAPQERDTQTGSRVCPCPPLSSTEQRTVPPEPGVQPSAPQERDSPPGQQPPPPSSLKHLTTLRVSLGAIDGLIHKYVKVDV